MYWKYLGIILSSSCSWPGVRIVCSTSYIIIIPCSIVRSIAPMPTWVLVRLLTEHMFVWIPFYWVPLGCTSSGGCVAVCLLDDILLGGYDILETNTEFQCIQAHSEETPLHARAYVRRFDLVRSISNWAWFVHNPWIVPRLLHGVYAEIACTLWDEPLPLSVMLINHSGSVGATTGALFREKW